MSYGILVLLDCFSEERYAIAQFDSLKNKHDIDIFFNREMPVWKGNELIMDVLFMEKKGLIRLASGERLSANLTTEEKWKSVIEITPKGAKLWERLFKPNWSRYVLDTAVFDRENKIVWISTIEERVALDLVKRLKKIKIKSQLSIIAPWMPTYWKILPKCYRVDFSCRELNSEGVSNVYFEYTSQEWKKSFFQKNSKAL